MRRVALRPAAALGAVLLAAVPASIASTRELPPASTLLAQYQPVLQLYRSDWTPTAVGTLLTQSWLERAVGRKWQVVRKAPPAPSLPASVGYRLDIRGCTPARDLPSCYRRRSTTAPTAAVVYGRAWVDPDPSAQIQVVLQYWLFSYLDDWRNALANPSSWQVHEGDWEVVLVALAGDGTPLQVAYSQHKLGVVAPWSSVQAAGGTHPVVYVALGSHANYLAPGHLGAAGTPHVVPSAFSGVDSPEPDFTAAEVSYGPPGVATRPARIVDITTGAPWLGFPGPWGDGNYLLIRNGTKPTAPFLHYRVGVSPTGPAFHPAWTTPLAPFSTWPADDGH